jgi:hypothetical protein
LLKLDSLDLISITGDAMVGLIVGVLFIKQIDIQRTLAMVKIAN